MDSTMKVSHISIGQGKMSPGDEPLVVCMKFAKAKLILMFQWKFSLSNFRFHNKVCKNYVSLLLTPSLLLCILLNQVSSRIPSSATVQEQNCTLALLL